MAVETSLSKMEDIVAPILKAVDRERRPPREEELSDCFNYDDPVVRFGVSKWSPEHFGKDPSRKHGGRAQERGIWAAAIKEGANDPGISLAPIIRA